MTVDVSTITVDQFKAQFRRGFPYLPVYDPTVIYNSGVEVYDPATNLFWDCIQNGTQGVAPGTDATRWQVADDDVDNYVQDADITNAFAEATSVFNQAIYPDDASITLAYLYLTAHYLANDLKAALAGLTAAGAFPVSSKSAGSVSESYAIPKAYTENAMLAPFTSSAYGMKWLSMTLPNLVGNMVAVCGHALP